ncbi:TPA: uracil-DNA glycosylase [Candidatus Woesearchaeota archaeon]|nr:uracil-DNA glycosylase [Candidatus Woesearchaeota archaeon]
MTTTLFTLAEQIRTCTACPLSKERFLAVPGDGLATAKIMFIGEAPGAEEDRQGRSFIGRSGKFLDTLFANANIQRKDVFITGSVKCHPPKNRTPTTLELTTCKNLWLDSQIKIIRPKLIVILGRVALLSLLQEKNIAELQGKKITRNNQDYFITYHPSAGMRFPKIKTAMEKDFETIKKLANSLI